MADTASAEKSERQGGESKRSKSSQMFGEIANVTSRAAGRAPTFVAAVAIVLIWAITGPLFGFSDTWQLVINTGTTIVTFLMVFFRRSTGRAGQTARRIVLDAPGAVDHFEHGRVDQPHTHELSNA